MLEKVKTVSVDCNHKPGRSHIKVQGYKGELGEVYLPVKIISEQYWHGTVGGSVLPTPPFLEMCQSLPKNVTHMLCQQRRK